MDKQKQIDEMARIIAFDLCPNRHVHAKWGEEAQCYSDNNFAECTKIKNVVDKLYNAGYRKESETAKEIYEILEKWAWKLKNEKGSLGNFAFGIETAMQEIKEKYSLQVGNFKLVELKKGKNDEEV